MEHLIEVSDRRCGILNLVSHGKILISTERVDHLVVSLLEFAALCVILLRDIIRLTLVVLDTLGFLVLTEYLESIQLLSHMVLSLRKELIYAH